MVFNANATKLRSYNASTTLGSYGSDFSASVDVFPNKVEYTMGARQVREDDTDAVDTEQACADQIDLVLRAYRLRVSRDAESGRNVIINMQFGDDGKPTGPMAVSAFAKMAEDLLRFIQRAPIDVPPYRAQRRAL